MAVAHEQLHKAQAPKSVLDLLHPVDDGCEGCSDPVKNAQMEASIKALAHQIAQASEPSLRAVCRYASALCRSDLAGH